MASVGVSKSSWRQSSADSSLPAQLLSPQGEASQEQHSKRIFDPSPNRKSSIVALASKSDTSTSTSSCGRASPGAAVADDVKNCDEAPNAATTLPSAEADCTNQVVMEKKESGKQQELQRHRIAFRHIVALEEAFAFHKKDSVIGKGAYSVVYRAMRKECPSVMLSTSVPFGTEVALKVISKVPEGYGGLCGAVTQHEPCPTVPNEGPTSNSDNDRAKGAAAQAKAGSTRANVRDAEADERRDDVMRELEVLNRLRCDGGDLTAQHLRSNSHAMRYNGCLQLLDALETPAHWCLVTAYDPEATDLATYYRRRATAQQRLQQRSLGFGMGLHTGGYGSSSSTLHRASLGGIGGENSCSSSASSFAASSANDRSHHPIDASALCAISPVGSALSEAHAALVMAQLIGLVRRLHSEQRLVHRDLKPENILLAPLPQRRLSPTCDGNDNGIGNTAAELKVGDGPAAPQTADCARKQQQQQAPHTLYAHRGVCEEGDENKKPVCSVTTGPNEMSGGSQVEAYSEAPHNEGSSCCIPLSEEMRRAGLVTLLDFGFSRFLHTDSVVVTADDGVCNKAPRPTTTASNSNSLGPGEEGLTVTPAALLLPDLGAGLGSTNTNNKFADPSMSDARAVANAIGATSFSTLVASPVVPRTPLLFPSVPCVTLGEEGASSPANFEPAPTGSLQQCQSTPAPLLLLTGCGTDKFLPYEALLWAVKKDFYPSVPRGLPPSYKVLVPSQPQHRPTTIAHAKALDSYALGVIAHILLSGRLPFDGQTRSSLFLQQSLLKAKAPPVALAKEVVGPEWWTSNYQQHQQPQPLPPLLPAACASSSSQPHQRGGEEGICALDSAAWKHISPAAKALVRGLLHINPSKRWSLEQAAASPWVRHVGAPIASRALSSEILAGLGLSLGEANPQSLLVN